MKLHFEHYGWKFLLLSLAVFVAFLWLVKAPLVSSFVAGKLQVPVSIGRVGLWPHTITFHNFKVVNPHGWENATALKAKQAEIRYHWSKLIGKVSEIDEITLDNVFVTIDILNETGSKTNWAAIGARMPKTMPGREVLIHKLIITNITVQILGKGAVTLGVAGKKQIDRMEFDEIDSREGFPTRELATQIFESAGVAKYIEEFLNPAQRIQEAINPFSFF